MLLPEKLCKEALNSGRALESILIAKGSKGGASAALVALAKDKGIPVKEVDSKNLIIYVAVQYTKV